MEVQGLMDTGQTPELEKLLEDHPAKENARTHATRAYLLASAYKKAGQIERMLEVADGFLKKYGPDLVILNLAAEAALVLYGKDRAEQYFEQMKANITDEDKLNDLLPVLQLAKELNKSTWAAEQILQRRQPGEPTNFDDILVVGLFNKQQYEQAIAIASELPRNEKTKHIHYFADTKALELEGNFEDLLDAADAMAVEFPDDDYPAAMHISGLIGLERDATLVQWFIDYESRVGLARAFGALNLCGSICEDHVIAGIKDLALSLRDRNTDNIEAHRHYVDFVNGLYAVRRWNERIQMVTKDCIVALRRVNSIMLVFISDNGTQGNAYHSESLEVRGIVGKFIGDACEFEGATHYIIDIGDTHVAAFVASREIVASQGL